MLYRNIRVEDEDRDELQQDFEDLYKDSITLAKKNKELKDVMEAMAKENQTLMNKMANMEKDIEQPTSINKDLEEELNEKNMELLKLLCGSQKLSTMLLYQNNPFTSLD